MRFVGWLCVALALSYVSTATAATRQLGVIAGFNLAKLNIDGQSDADTRSGFAAGGVLDLGINPHFGVRIEPMFLPRGGKNTHRNAYWGSVDGAEFQLDYISIPVLARLNLSEGSDSEARPYVLGGFGFDFATSSDVKLTRGSHTETVDFGDVFSSTDLTLDLGAGVAVPAGDNHMTFDARVGIGLLDINDGGTVTFAGAPLAVPSTSTHTLDFRVFATYLFPWK